MRKNRSSHFSPNTTCHHHSLCYDRLIEKCISCKVMQRGGTEKETTTILTVASITTQIPAPLTTEQTCSALTFVFVGLTFTIAALCFVMYLKQKRKKKMRKAGNDHSIENEVQKDLGCSPGDDSPELPECLHSVVTSDTSTEENFKRNVHHIPVPGNDVMDVNFLPSDDNNGNPTFPVPATELGATMLVTTKTTQENFLSEKLALQQV
ncbi:tumor necrosis factor receptor superfamily member 17 isoform X2 [Anolis carolinensis]|uniref:tumor necrosis factor receptor superfamily member 17 isoform X2 n=1 Tax=Anolis carolinensis TaxID=28377 RepID=UPI000462576D|nr:PREDICTED: tumor necrosis factor receptor superfamily member 17 isoform X2 [Anolis carolinensis]|eukprot:XP_008108967.1 PREDICTED: tumor necrosis factor receptor superfamily member 17 isoform X2 [Anolis carolinensis]